MDGAELGLWTARFFFGFGVLAFLLHFLQPAISQFIARPKKQDKSHPDRYTSLSVEEVQRRQELARQQIQDKHTNKAQSYKERILQPREELRLRKREEKFLQFSSTKWNSTGHKLGGENWEAVEESRSRDAARHRKLPVSREASTPVAPCTPPVEKKMPVLPLEPAEGSSGSVCMMLRTLQGTVHKRRFLTSDTAQVLLDYMTLLGYHQKLYTLCTSYPRCSLSCHPDRTLQELGLDRDSILNVELRD
jgi:hypothetical protein